MNSQKGFENKFWCRFQQWLSGPRNEGSSRYNYIAESEVRSFLMARPARLMKMCQFRTLKRQLGTREYHSRVCILTPHPCPQRFFTSSRGGRSREYIYIYIVAFFPRAGKSAVLRSFVHSTHERRHLLRTKIIDFSSTYRYSDTCVSFILCSVVICTRSRV